MNDVTKRDTAVLSRAGVQAGTDQDAMPVFASEPSVFGIARSRWPAIIAPIVVGVLALAFWEWIVWYRQIPHYVLPGPIQIAQTMVSDWATLSGSLWITLRITAAALIAAVTVGVALAVLFTQSKWLEMSLFPYAVVLQVTLPREFEQVYQVPAAASCAFTVVAAIGEIVNAT